MVLSSDTIGGLYGQTCKADGAEEAEAERESSLQCPPVRSHISAESSQGEDGGHGRKEDDEEDEEICWLVHCMRLLGVCLQT